MFVESSTRKVLQRHDLWFILYDEMIFCSSHAAICFTRQTQEAFAFTVRDIESIRCPSELMVQRSLINLEVVSPLLLLVAAHPDIPLYSPVLVRMPVSPTLVAPLLLVFGVMGTFGVRMVRNIHLSWSHSS